MRTPGFGDSNWTRRHQRAAARRLTGSIDIEGWHDPVYRDALEMTGQVRALNYLKECRGGRRSCRTGLRRLAEPAEAGTRASRTPPTGGTKGGKYEALNEQRLSAGRPSALLRRIAATATAPGRRAARQVVQERPHPLLRRRRRGRCLRLDRLQRRRAGRERHRRAGRLRVLRLEGGEDGAAAARGGRRQARWHRHDGPSGRRRDHAAGRAGLQGRHQDDVPERAGADEVVAKFGGGYVGAQQAPQGKALGEEAVRRFGLKSGDTAIVLGPFDAARAARVREGGTADALEEAGLKVDQASTSPPEWAADPNLGDPGRSPPRSPPIPTSRRSSIRAASCSATLPTYMQAAGKKPGEIINIGFDTSPQIVAGLQGRLGAAHRRPAAVPAGLPADPQPLPAGGLRPRRRSTSTPAPAS